MRLRERVARNLRRLRAERSFSQHELAHRADINLNYVGMIEREEYSVSLDKLEALAEALGVDPIEFFRTGKRTIDRD
jgi:transcriptional regulator with XRE-family HTH domain